MGGFSYWKTIHKCWESHVWFEQLAPTEQSGLDISTQQLGHLLSLKRNGLWPWGKVVNHSYSEEIVCLQTHHFFLDLAPLCLHVFLTFYNRLTNSYQSVSVFSRVRWNNSVLLGYFYSENCSWYWLGHSHWSEASRNFSVAILVAYSARFSLKLSAQPSILDI